MYYALRGQGTVAGALDAGLTACLVVGDRAAPTSTAFSMENWLEPCWNRASLCIVTTFDGQPLPPLHTSKTYMRPGLVVAISEAVHADLLRAIGNMCI